MMQNDKYGLILLSILTVFLITSCKKEVPEPLGSISIGYYAEDILQLPIVEAIKRTDISDAYLIKTNLSPISLENLLETPAVDIAFLPLTEAIELLDKNDSWFIAGRLVNNRVMLYSPLDAPIDSIGALDGKRVAITSGTQAHRLLLEALEGEGFHVGTEVRLSNLPAESLFDLADKKHRQEWGDYDAFASAQDKLIPFEIHREINYEELGDIPTLILISKQFAQQNTDIVDHFLASLMQNYLYVAKNFGTTVSWAKQNLPLDIDSTLVWRIGIMEPNFRAMLKGHISLNLPAPKIDNIQRAVDFMAEREVIVKPFSVTQFLDLSYLRMGETLFWNNRMYESMSVPYQQ